MRLMHPRHIAPLLVEALADTPVVVLNGARQSGKSTLVQSLAATLLPQRQYLTMDDAVVLNAAKADPSGFISGLAGPATLDEVRRALPSLLQLLAARSATLLNFAELSRSCALPQSTLKHLAFSAQRLSLWHYRTQTNIEMDFVLENRMGQLTGIEVKASATVDGKDFKGLRHLQETEPESFIRGFVLYAGREMVPFGEKLWAVPQA